jgi:hypothetical protein
MRPIVLAGLALATVTLLAGCSGSSTGRESLARGGPAKAAAPADAGAAGGTARDTSGGGGAAKAAPDVADPQAKIRKADITVSIAHADEVSAKADQAAVIARRYGGDVDAEQRSSGPHASATLTLKVRPDDLSATLTDLSALGTELDRHQSTENVTQQVADVDSRVRSARLAIDKLDALYAQASKVSDLLVIDGQLADRQSDLEALLAQQRALAGQVAMATVDVTLTTATAPPPATHHDKRTGFLGGLSRGWDAFTSAAGGIATGLGAALPFLVLFALLAAGAVYTYRRSRRTVPPQPAAE